MDKQPTVDVSCNEQSNLESRPAWQEPEVMDGEADFPSLPISILRLFQKLSNQQINYCLLRDCTDVELATAVELDLLLDPRHLSRFRGVSSECGFASLPNLGHSPHHFFIAYDRDCDRWIKLDVVTELAFGRPVLNLRTTLGQGCLARRQPWASTFIPAPEDELVTLLLHCVLDKGHVDRKRGVRLRSLAGNVQDQPYLTLLLERHWSTGWPELADMINCENWQGLLAQGKAVGSQLAKPDRLGVIFRLVEHRVLRKLNRWLGRYGNRGLTVALLGPDGAGKSTLAEGVRHSFYFPVRSIYMGLYQKDSGVSVNGSRIRGLGFFGRLFRQWSRYLVAQFHKSRGRLVLFDRYSYDSMLQSSKPLALTRRLRRWLLAHSCPSPALVLLLDAPGDVLFARKGEHHPAELERQRQGYLQMLRRFPDTVIVNAARDRDAVRRDATYAIWQRFARQFDR